jgi:hypothetical protein
LENSPSYAIDPIFLVVEAYMMPLESTRVKIMRSHFLQKFKNFASLTNNLPVEPRSYSWEQLSQCRWVYLTSSEEHTTLRRMRKPFGQLKEVPVVGVRVDFGDLQLPYEHGEENVDEYLKKTTLSPWVPMPDSAARKMMDLAAASASDFHVDLGSGDGRVNFHAIDYGVSKSLGIDIDEKIVQVARDRLMKRHPQPKLEFIVADLLKDTNHPVWTQIKDATIITMYFATEALRLFRPVLEAKLAGHKCKILTCGYEMPGWISRTQEVVNAMPLYLYEWGTFYDDDDSNSLLTFKGDDFWERHVPKEMLQNQLENDKFAGMNVIDRTNEHPIPWYNPNYIEEPDEDEEEWGVDPPDQESAKDEGEVVDEKDKI